MAPVDVVALARSMIDIDSTSGGEAEASRFVAAWLRERGFRVDEQPVEADRFNVLARVGDARPEVVLSTHIDTVPPFFPSRVEGDRLYGRGACDAKGILAAQLAALDRLRASGEVRVGLLVVVGEERGSAGALAANTLSPQSRYLVNGEPTDSRLGTATRGVFRVKIEAAGRTAHSSHPELGDSAIEKLLDALVALRTMELPVDPRLGRTTYTIGVMSGGVAPNVVPPVAEADVNFRTVGPAAEVREHLETRLAGIDVRVHDATEVPPVELTTVPGFDYEAFPFSTDIPFLTAWGQPLLFGPGSILAAHTADEHVSIPEMEAAVGHYVTIAQRLLESHS